MDKETEQQGLEHLETIEEEVEDLRHRTTSLRQVFVRGVLQGAGIIAGTLLALAVLGWILSLFGLVPGLDEFRVYLEGLREEI